MGLTKKWDIERTWGSHQALLKSVLKVLKPQSAVECGCGNYSTPFLREVPHLITIEHDLKWAEQMNCLNSGENHQWWLKAFNAKNPTRINELPEGEFEEMEKYYKSCVEKIKPFDLLFVDTFTACRVPAVLSLGQLSQHIIIHDMESPGPEVYEWDRLADFLSGWNKVIHKPLGHVGHGHQIPWTGFYSTEPIPLAELNEGMKEESKRLWDDFTPLVETNLYD